MIWLRRKSIEPGSRYVLGAEIANPRVSVSVPRTAHLAIIGESNSGKGSVLANLILQEVTNGGEIWFVDLKAGPAWKPKTTRRCWIVRHMTSMKQRLCSPTSTLE